MRNLRILPDRVSRGGRKQFKATLDRARALIAQQPPPAARNVVEFSRLDRVILDNQTAKWPRYNQLLQRGNERISTFEDLLSDLFYGLYLYEPRLRQRGAMAPAHRVNYDLYMQTQKLNLWEQARINATLSPKHAIIGLVYVAQALLDAIDDDTADKMRERDEQYNAQQQARSQPMQELSDLIDQLAQALDEMPDDEPDDEPDGQPGDQPATNALAAMIARVSEAAPGAAEAEPDADEQQALDNLTSVIDDLESLLAPQPGNELDIDESESSKLRIAARTGLKQATDALDELDDMLATWGSDAAEFNALDPATAFSLFDRIKSLPNIADFTIELGRMRNAGLEAQMQSNAREPQEIVDITTGRTWSDVLPSERVLLGDKRTAPLFWARMIQEGLLTWAYAGREPANRGPFILLVDVSGSTSGPKERWAKAFTLAAMDMARRDQRDCGVIFFDTIVEDRGVFTFRNGYASLLEKVSVAEYWTGGGTDWMPPLSMALANIEATDGTWQKADIVLVTDGECDVTPEFTADYRQRCLAKGIRTHGVLLDLGSHVTRSLEPFCDRVFPVSSLGGSDAAKPIFDSLVS